MGAVRAGSPDLRKLARRLKPGYHLEADGKAKVRIVVTATGEPVRMPDGRPIGMPNSVGSEMARTVERRLAALGLLKTGRGA